MKKEIEHSRRDFMKTLGVTSGLSLGGWGAVIGSEKAGKNVGLNPPDNLNSGLVKASYVNADFRLDVTLESIDVLIKSEEEIVNFPRLIRLKDDKTLILAYGKGRHGWDDRRLAAFSNDDGKTWQDFPEGSHWNDNIQTSGVLGYLRDGAIAYVDVHPIDSGDHKDLKKPWHQTYFPNPSWRLRKFSDSGDLIEDTTFKVKNLPWKEGAYCCYGDLLDFGNGELLCPLGVQLPDTKIKEGSSIGITTFFARSKDNGKTFEYLSHIPADLDGEPLTQGFNEPTLRILPGGEVICVGRTGGYDPLYQAWSRDRGETWSKVVSTGWPAAKPDLRLLENGILACSSGRGSYGHPQITHAMFSLDGRGERWEAPFVFHTGPGCSYTSNMEKNGKLYVAYSDSSFNKDKGAYNLPYQSIKWAVLNLDKTVR